MPCLDHATKMFAKSFSNQDKHVWALLHRATLTSYSTSTKVFVVGERVLQALLKQCSSNNTCIAPPFWDIVTFSSPAVMETFALTVQSTAIDLGIACTPVIVETHRLDTGATTTTRRIERITTARFKVFGDVIIHCRQYHGSPDPRAGAASFCRGQILANSTVCNVRTGRVQDITGRALSCVGSRSISLHRPHRIISRRPSSIFELAAWAALHPSFGIDNTTMRALIAPSTLVAVSRVDPVKAWTQARRAYNGKATAFWQCLLDIGVLGHSLSPMGLVAYEVYAALVEPGADYVTDLAALLAFRDSTDPVFTIITPAVSRTLTLAKDLGDCKSDTAAFEVALRSGGRTEWGRASAIAIALLQYQEQASFPGHLVLVKSMATVVDEGAYWPVVEVGPEYRLVTPHWCTKMLGVDADATFWEQQRLWAFMHASQYIAKGKAAVIRAWIRDVHGDKMRRRRPHNGMWGSTERGWCQLSGSSPPSPR